MTTAIKNVRILREHGEILETGSLIFDETGILEIRDTADAHELPETVRRIDGAGGTLLPGLIDCHVHLGCGAMDEGTSEEEQGMALVLQMETFLRHGITTVRSMGTKDNCDIKIRNLVESG